MERLNGNRLALKGIAHVLSQASRCCKANPVRILRLITGWRMVNGNVSPPLIDLPIRLQIINPRAPKPVAANLQHRLRSRERARMVWLSEPRSDSAFRMTE
jgi:hypothetical protein